MSRQRLLHFHMKASITQQKAPFGQLIRKKNLNAFDIATHNIFYERDDLFDLFGMVWAHNLSSPSGLVKYQGETFWLWQ